MIKNHVRKCPGTQSGPHVVTEILKRGRQEDESQIRRYENGSREKFENIMLLEP
jgi:hypothetical protein